tara:strand:+ start:48 stop:626 length:579 start_codon:yes stop_codon:yes gene_type:complete
MQIKIFDDFLTKSYHEEILKLMSSFNFPWYWQDNITLKEGSKNLNKYGFSHIFWTQEAGQRNSIETLFLKSALLQMLDVTECNSIVRSRADMTTYVGKEFIHDPHIDFDFPHIASIYYVNDSDGDTIFYNQKTYDTNQIDNLDLQEYKRVTPKANRLVIFEGDIVHTGSSPVNSKKRILINSNFLTTKKNVL